MVPQYERPTSLIDCAARLCDLGYYPVPIPAGCKGPDQPGWQHLRLTAEHCPRHFAGAGLIGVLHVNVLALDIDVYDADLSAVIRDEALRRWPGALERIGEAPKTALFLRMDEPGFKCPGTRTHERSDGTKAQVDIRSVSRQIVVYGRHPATEKPYTWPRGELWETPRENLPAITHAEAEAFRDWCQEQLDAWAPMPRNVVDFPTPGLPLRNDNERPSPEAFRAALRHVPADVGYDDWLSGLMAIHDFYGGSAEGLAVAQEWSAPYADYDPREVEQKWRSFEVGRGVTYKSIFGLAKANGADMQSIARIDKGDRSKPSLGPLTDDFTAASPEDRKSGAETDNEFLDDPEPPAAPFKSWEPLNPLDIPERDFVYGRHYIRKFASVTVAPGGLGKSTLVLAEMIAIATGRPILGIQPKRRERVVYFNAEDPLDEIQRRVFAIIQHHNIPQEELVGWLYLASGRDYDLILSYGEDGQIFEEAFALMERFAAEVKPGVMAFDPLANMTEAPETNDVFRRLGKRLSRFADKCDLSVENVHHTRKLNGKEAEVEDSRGGGALIGAVRSARVLNPMTPEDAAKAGLETHIDHFKIEAAGKNNLARAAETATWLRRVSVEIPNGDLVAAVEPWAWPDAFDGVSSEDARRVQLAIGSMEDDPPRANVQSAQWVGLTVARVLGMDPDDKAHRSRINSMIRAWLKTGVLEIVEVRDRRNGRDVKAILAGGNNPASKGE